MGIMSTLLRSLSGHYRVLSRRYRASLGIIDAECDILKLQVCVRCIAGWESRASVTVCSEHFNISPSQVAAAALAWAQVTPKGSKLISLDFSRSSSSLLIWTQVTQHQYQMSACVKCYYFQNQYNLLYFCKKCFMYWCSFSHLHLFNSANYVLIWQSVTALNCFNPIVLMMFLSLPRSNVVSRVTNSWQCDVSHVTYIGLSS